MNLVRNHGKLALFSSKVSLVHVKCSLVNSRCNNFVESPKKTNKIKKIAQMFLWAERMQSKQTQQKKNDSKFEKKNSKIFMFLLKLFHWTRKKHFFNTNRKCFDHSSRTSKFSEIFQRNRLDKMLPSTTGSCKMQFWQNQQAIIGLKIE